MPPVEAALFCAHHASTLLFGVFASAVLCGVTLTRRHVTELLCVAAASGAAFALASLAAGELFARQVYPLAVHLPLVVFLCARHRVSPLLALLGVTSAYLCCQLSNWMGIAALAASGSQTTYYVVRIAVTLATLAALLRLGRELGTHLALKTPAELGILLMLPAVYYVFDYATTVYTTLLHSGSVVTVEFLAFALCAFYLLFLGVYLHEYEAKEEAERERWMIEARDGALSKELDAWRRSGRELSVLRHDMRHFLHGLAALVEEGRTDEALARIDEICAANDRTAVRRRCANETVNIALSSFDEKIACSGIRARLRAAVPAELPVADIDLFCVLSNALENAVAAAGEAPAGQRVVELDLRLEDERLLLLVSNTFGMAPQVVDGMPVAARPGHGLGTQSIRMAVERMGGNCQFRVADGRFELRAVM